MSFDELEKEILSVAEDANSRVHQLGFIIEKFEENFRRILNELIFIRDKLDIESNIIDSNTQKIAEAIKIMNSLKENEKIFKNFGNKRYY